MPSDLLTHYVAAYIDSSGIYTHIKCAETDELLYGWIKLYTSEEIPAHARCFHCDKYLSEK